ncbi:MAG TPA: hypothetical protein VKB29_07390 [Candidatus Binataceae bacterium]|nr:hypothetical protein [Candidatus Binataceae bacterium]
MIGRTDTVVCKRKWAVLPELLAASERRCAARYQDGYIVKSSWIMGGCIGVELSEMELMEAECASGDSFALPAIGGAQSFGPGAKLPPPSRLEAIGGFQRQVMAARSTAEIAAATVNPS